jgi:peptidoglycan/xylan/chitin deacetylase (PgdA/CDA1 family)
VQHGPRKTNAVALTFDADLTPAMLRNLDSGRVASYADTQVIRELREAHAPATIFVVGLWARRYPQLLVSLARDPLFEIENHSWSHPAFKEPCFGLEPVTDPGAEISKAQDEITKVIGRSPRYFRFPGGCSTAADVQLVTAHGLTPVGWDVVSGDPYLRDPDAVVGNVLRGARGGSIVVMHLTGPARTPATAAAVPRIIEGLRARGLRLVKLTELLRS